MFTEVDGFLRETKNKLKDQWDRKKVIVGKGGRVEVTRMHVEVKTR